MGEGGGGSIGGPLPVDPDTQRWTELNGLLLMAWANEQNFQLVSVTRDANGTIASATIKWPDGTGGTFTTDLASAEFPGAIDAWRATYLGEATKTVVQAAVTRDANGSVIAQPDITIT